MIDNTLEVHEQFSFGVLNKNVIEFSVVVILSLLQNSSSVYHGYCVTSERECTEYWLTTWEKHVAWFDYPGLTSVAKYPFLK